MTEVALKYFVLRTWSLIAEIAHFAFFRTKLLQVRQQQRQKKCLLRKPALHNYQNGIGETRFISVLPTPKLAGRYNQRWILIFLRHQNWIISQIS